MTTAEDYRRGGRKATKSSDSFWAETSPPAHRADCWWSPLAAGAGHGYGDR
jgi:hypothetical protein